MTYGALMIPVRSVIEPDDAIAALIAIVMISVLCYVGGRVHQYFLQGVQRDHAFREGYNTATKALFSLATRTSRTVEAKPPLEQGDKPPTLRGSAQVGAPRHRAEGKSTLQQTKTFTAWELHKSA